MPRCCILCLACEAPRKPPGGSIALRDALETDEEWADHIEMVHCIPVRRPGESTEQAVRRLAAKNPDYASARCTCPGCVKHRHLLRELSDGDHQAPPLP